MTLDGRSRRSLGERVGSDYGWLAAQFTLLGTTIASGPGGNWLVGRFAVPWPQPVELGAGILLMLAGVVVARQASADLGDSLCVAPTPLEEAEMVERGWYARVRHPLYLAVFLGISGWAAVWMNGPVVAAGLVTIVFFTLKTRHEERKLRETYAGYAGYMRRVSARFVPKTW